MKRTCAVVDANFPRGVIDEFLASLEIQHPEARPILDASMLSPCLEDRVETLGDEYCWRAWEHDGRLRFVVMRLGSWRSARSRARQLVTAYFYDASARLLSSGTWIRLGRGNWAFVDRGDSGTASTGQLAEGDFPAARQEWG